MSVTVKPMCRDPLQRHLRRRSRSSVASCSTVLTSVHRDLPAGEAVVEADAGHHGRGSLFIPRPSLRGPSSARGELPRTHDISARRCSSVPMCLGGGRNSRPSCRARHSSQRPDQRPLPRGEPGIGKSTLLAPRNRRAPDLQSRAEADGGRIRAGHAGWPSAESDPAGHSGRSARTTARGRSRCAVGRVAPAGSGSLPRCCRHSVAAGGSSRSTSPSWCCSTISSGWIENRWSR